MLRIPRLRLPVPSPWHRVCCPFLKRYSPVCDVAAESLARKQLQELAYGDGHTVNGVVVPTQGFNVFASVTMSGACCSMVLLVSADTLGAD